VYQQIKWDCARGEESPCCSSRLVQSPTGNENQRLAKSVCASDRWMVHHHGGRKLVFAPPLRNRGDARGIFRRPSALHSRLHAGFGCRVQPGRSSCGRLPKELRAWFAIVRQANCSRREFLPYLSVPDPASSSRRHVRGYFATCIELVEPTRQFHRGRGSPCIPVAQPRSTCSQSRLINSGFHLPGVPIGVSRSPVVPAHHIT